MSQWDYVIMAYAVAIGGTIFVLWRCWSDLRKSEKKLEELKRNQK